MIKFIYSEEATKFCKISTYFAKIKDKIKVEISQNFVAFLECMNFTIFILTYSEKNFWN